MVYVSSYPNCGLFLLTFILRCLDTFDSALNIHILYFYMVTNFLKPQAVDVPIWCVSNGIRRQPHASYQCYIRSIGALR